LPASGVIIRNQRRGFRCFNDRKCLGKDLRDDRGSNPCPDGPSRPWCRTPVPRPAGCPARIVDGFRSEVLRKPYHAPAIQRPRFITVSLVRVELRAFGFFAFSTRAQRSKAGRCELDQRSDADRGHPNPPMRFQAKIERIEPQPFSATINRRFPERWPMRHAEPARRLRVGNGVQPPCCGRVGRGYIRARGMDWQARLAQVGPNWHKHCVGNPRQSVSPESVHRALPRLERDLRGWRLVASWQSSRRGYRSYVRGGPFSVRMAMGLQRQINFDPKPHHCRRTMRLFSLGRSRIGQPPRVHTGGFGLQA